MNKKYGLMIASTLTILLATIQFAHTVDAQTTGCYAYSWSAASSASTVQVPIRLSSGASQNITIVNQNPPSILQEMDFPTSNAGYCSNYYYANDTVGLQFVTSSGNVSFDGYPASASSVFSNLSSDSAWTSLNEYIVLNPMVYYGLSDVPSTAAENSLIKSVDASHQLTIEADTYTPSTSGIYESNRMSAPATNCVALTQTGAQKIVFMRGSAWNSSIGDFLSAAENSLNATQPNGKPVIPTGFDYSADLKPWNESGTATYSALNSANSCGASSPAGYVLLSTTKSTNAFSISNGVYATLYTQVPKVTVITIGGIGSGVSYLPFSGIFSWVDSNIQPSTPVQSHGNSFGGNLNVVIGEINDALAAGNKVLVVGHSLGSILAYTAAHTADSQGNRFADNPNVGFVYVDPLYAPNFVLAPLFKAATFAFGIYKPAALADAGSSNISNDPNSVIWTNGAAILHPLVHDAFDNQTYGNNPQNLANLRTTIQSKLLGLDLVTGGSFAQLSIPSLATPPSAPNIASIEDAGGNAISSAGPGDALYITGSGFDPNANDIYIQSVDDPDVFYYLYDYPADSSGTIAFTLPQAFDLANSNGAEDVVPGTYTIQVAAYNSGWSSPGTLTINAAATPPVPSSVAPDTSTPNQYIISGSGFSPTNNAVELIPTSLSSAMKKINTASAIDSAIEFIESLFGSKAHAQTASGAYLISGLSSNGSTITFQIPSNVPNGTYMVSVRSQNTAWVATNKTITVSGSTATGGTSGSGGTGSGSTGTGSGSSSVTPPAPYNPVYGPNGASGLPSTITPAQPNYSCASGYALQSNNTCYQAAHTVSNTTNSAASVSYSCPSGYYLSGSSCSETVSVAATTISASVSYNCNLFPTGTVYNSLTHSCINGYGTFSANVVYSCPSGDTLSGNICNVPATTKTLTQAATASYSCPSGTLSGTQCAVTTTTSVSASYANASVSYSCPAGYTLAPDNSCAINAGPSGLSATAKSGSMSLSWNDNGIQNVDSVEVDRGPDSSSLSALTQLSAGASSYTDASVSAGSSYSYRVKIKYQNGNYSSPSNVASGTIPTTGISGLPTFLPTTVPGTPSCSVGVVIQDSFCRQYNSSGWTDYGNGQYFSYICPDGYAYYSGACRLLGVSGVYTCPIGYVSSGSNFCNLVTTVTNLTAVPTATKVALSWTNDVANVQTVNIYRATSTDQSPAFAIIGTSTAASTQYTDATAFPLTSYSYEVGLTFLNGNSSPVAGPVATTTLSLIATPTLSVKSSSAGSFTFSLKDSTSGITGWQLASTATGSPALNVALTSTQTTYTWISNSLPPSTTYCFQVKAFKGIYYSLPSAPACATTYANSVPAPSLTASQSGGSIKLSWSDSSSSLYSYAIYNVSSTSPLTTLIATTTALSYTIAGLPASTQSCYQVTASLPVAGYVSKPSSVACATTAGLKAPSNLKLANPAAGQVQASWSVANAAAGLLGTSISRSTLKSSGFAEIAVATGTTYTDSAVPSGSTVYYYAVRFKYASGYSPYSATTSVTITKPATAAAVATSATTSVPAAKSASVAPITTYSCPSGATLSGTSCLSSGTATQSIKASSTPTCPPGYLPSGIIAGQCYRGSTLNLTPAISTSYSCPSGYTLNTTTHYCDPQTSPAKPATPTYSCPAGYTLSGANQSYTCRPQSSTVEAAAYMAQTNSTNALGYISKWIESFFDLLK